MLPAGETTSAQTSTYRETNMNLFFTRILFITCLYLTGLLGCTLGFDFSHPAPQSDTSYEDDLIPPKDTTDTPPDTQYDPIAETDEPEDNCQNSSRSCYTGPPETKNVGNCKQGEYICVDNELL